MTDDPGLPGRVRRVGAQDRKSHIDAPASLIPADDPAPAPEAGILPGEGPVVTWPEPDEIDRSLDEMVESILPPEPPPAPKPRPRAPVRVIERPRRRSWPYNLAALLFLALACGACAWFTVIWQNPYGAWNFFPPLTPLPVVVSMTPTITETPIPTETATLAPTLTPSITPTPAPTVPPTDTPVPVPATGAGSFAPVETTGRAVVFIANPEARGGCAWQSIAGSVSDLAGTSLNGYQIRVLGDGVDTTAISGEATGYGPGGFEAQLGSEAREAQFAVQLLDPGGTPVSEAITVPTSARCDWNISLVRFQQQAGN